jgi:hypothetical protein
MEGGPPSTVIKRRRDYWIRHWRVLDPSVERARLCQR